MVLVAGRTGIDYRRNASLDRASRDLDSIPIVVGCLARITTATALPSPQVKRWIYDWVEAEIGPAPDYVPGAKAHGIAGTCLSASELSNGAKICYGVTVATLPAGFAAVQIPINTTVWVVPQRLADGNMMWVILNTQAIDGVC